MSQEIIGRRKIFITKETQKRVWKYTKNIHIYIAFSICNLSNLMQFIITTFTILAQRKYENFRKNKNIDLK